MKTQLRTTKHAILAGLLLLLFTSSLFANTAFIFADNDDDDDEKAREGDRSGKGGGDGNRDEDDEDDEDEEVGAADVPAAVRDAAINHLLQAGFGGTAADYSVREAELEKGIWELKITRGDSEFEVKVDARASPPRVIKSEAEEGVEVEKREVRVETSGNQVTIKLEKATDAREDELKIRLETAEGPNIRLEFSREVGRAEAEFELKVTLLELIEFKDAAGQTGDAIGRFDPGTDTVVSRFATQALSWGAPTVEDITRDGKAGKKITVAATIPGTSGTSGEFKLVFYTFGDFAQVGGTSLRPTEAKIDIVVTNYPFSTGTHLAVFLKAKMEAESEVRPTQEAGEEGLSVTLGDLMAIFTWKTTVKVDNVDHPVKVTTASSKVESETKVEGGKTEEKQEREERLYFSYPKGASIIHDPKIGLTIRTAALPGIYNIPTYILVTVGVTVVAALLIGLGRRGLLNHNSLPVRTSRQGLRKQAFVPPIRH